MELGAPARPGRPGARPGSRPRHSPAGSRPLRYARPRVVSRARCARRQPRARPLRRARPCMVRAARGAGRQVAPRRCGPRTARARTPPACERPWSLPGSSSSSYGGTSRTARAPATTWATGTTWTTRWRRRLTRACAAPSPLRTPTYVSTFAPSSPHDACLQPPRWSVCNAHMSSIVYITDVFYVNDAKVHFMW